MISKVNLIQNSEVVSRSNNFFQQIFSTYCENDDKWVIMVNMCQVKHPRSSVGHEKIYHARKKEMIEVVIKRIIRSLGLSWNNTEDMTLKNIKIIRKKTKIRKGFQRSFEGYEANILKILVMTLPRSS